MDRLGLLESENPRKACTQIACKVVSVLLSQKLPTSRSVTKCKPERTIRNCDMAYSHNRTLTSCTIFSSSSWCTGSFLIFSKVSYRVGHWDNLPPSPNTILNSTSPTRNITFTPALTLKSSLACVKYMCSQDYFHTCPLWPWPLISDLQTQ